MKNLKLFNTEIKESKEYSIGDIVSGYDDAIIIYLSDEKDKPGKVAYLKSIATENGLTAFSSGSSSGCSSGSTSRKNY